MIRTARFTLSTLILATATLLASPPRSAPAAFAEFSYTYTLSGTITEVDDLRAVVGPPGNPLLGQTFHLLPGLEVGDPITATGMVAGHVQDDGYAPLTFALIAVDAPDEFRFTTTVHGGGELFDPADPNAGFSLVIGNFDSEHPAISPGLSVFDIVERTAIFEFGPLGQDVQIRIYHPSLQIGNYATVRADITSVELTPSPVPEPGAWGLLAVGLAGAWAGRRMIAWRTG